MAKNLQKRRSPNAADRPNAAASRARGQKGTGPPPKPVSRKYAEPSVYEVVYLFSTGLSVRDIAKSVKSNRQRVMNCLHKAFRDGIVVLPPVAPTRLLE